MKRVGLCVVLLLVTSCGAGASSSLVTAMKVEQASTTGSDALNLNERALKVGQPRRGSEITTLVLDANRFRARDNHVSEFIGLLVRQCVSRNARKSAEIDWHDWVAVDTMSGLYPGSSTSLEDFLVLALDHFPVTIFPMHGEIQPGECEQGLLFILVPQDRKIETIALRSRGTTVAEWPIL